MRYTLIVVDSNNDGWDLANVNESVPAILFADTFAEHTLHSAKVYVLDNITESIIHDTSERKS